MMAAARSTNRLFGLRGRPALVRNAVLPAVPRALATRAVTRQLRFTPPPVREPSTVPA